MSGRVALIVPSFPKLSERFLVAKFLGLLTRGWDAHVVCAASDPAAWLEFPKLERWPDIRRRVHVCWPTRPRTVAAALLPLVLARCSLRHARTTGRYLARGWEKFGVDGVRRLYVDAELVRLRPDLIHFEFGALAAHRMSLKELLGSRVVVSFRGYDLNYVGLEDPQYYADVWARADALHFLGHDLWRRARLRGCPADKTHALIPPAVDTALFDPGGPREAPVAGSRRRPLRVLSMGRLEWIKGYEYALQAIRLLRDRNICCEYRIGGDGQFLEAVAFARHQLGIEDAVHVLLARRPDQVKADMLWADVLLHAAVSEGFCNAVLEAAAMKLAVVATDAGGLPENVENGRTGLVVPRRDPAALAAALEQLAVDSELRRRMGEAGCQRVIDRFQVADQVQAFDRLYRQLLANGHEHDAVRTARGAA